MSDTPRQYADRDHRALGDYYLRHVSAMTAEGLHAKSAIAAELAWRDERIAAMTRERDDAYANVEDADRELKALRAEVERLRDALDTLTLVVGLTPIAGNKDALQQAVDVARAALQEPTP